MLDSGALSLSDLIVAADRLSARVAVGREASASWSELVRGSAFSERVDEVRGRCVISATMDPLLAAATLVALDGVARRIVLCPPDLSRENLAFVAECAGADVLITDEPASNSLDSSIPSIALEKPALLRDTGCGGQSRGEQVETEWILLTSGTTGRPKLVAHTLASLSGAIERTVVSAAPIVWSTFYDIRRFGGLQIFLRAAVTGTSLVLKGAHESTADFLERAGAEGVTHISGTPSQWRQALMSPAARNIAPDYVRLSGEIADQAILKQLHQQYPSARIAHAFASTEAGVAFEVKDGAMGFPSELVDSCPNVEMKVEGDTLRIR